MTMAFKIKMKTKKSKSERCIIAKQKKGVSKKEAIKLCDGNMQKRL
jgi:hypothetical protein